jgi:hypothetical protein
LHKSVSAVRFDLATLVHKFVESSLAIVNFSVERTRGTHLFRGNTVKVAKNGSKLARFMGALQMVFPSRNAPAFYGPRRLSLSNNYENDSNDKKVGLPKKSSSKLNSKKVLTQCVGTWTSRFF